MKYLNIILLLTLLIIFSCQDNIQEKELTENTIIKIDERQVVLADWIPPSCASISVFVSPNCGANTEQAVQEAIDAYNETDTAIFMEPASTEDSADIVVDCVESLGINLATGQFPTEDGKVGGPILVTNGIENSCEDPCFLKGIIIHEMGHALGIGHNGITAGTTSNGDRLNFDQIENTDSRGRDRGSIFNAIAPDCDDPNCTFSEDDIVALETIYPVPNPCDCPEVHPRHACAEWESQIIESQCPCPPGFKCVGGKNCVEL